MTDKVPNPSGDPSDDVERRASPVDAQSEPVESSSDPVDAPSEPVDAPSEPVESPQARSPVDDFAPDEDDGVSRILLLVSHARNRSILSEWLADQTEYEFIDGLPRLRERRRRMEGTWPRNDGGEGSSTFAADGDDQWANADDHADDDANADADADERSIVSDPLEAEPIDLVLVDSAALSAHGEWLDRRITAEQPLPLPCLLLATAATKDGFFSPTRGHTWQELVDDVVTTPVDPVVLERRLSTYLNIRRQAVALARRHDQLTLLSQVVRHDIANAATVITGWGYILRDSLSGEEGESLERILRAGQRVVEIVENSRDLTELIGSGHTAVMQAMVLAPVLQAEIDTIRRVHESTSQGVTVDVETPLPMVEVVAGGMLASVFANLLSNAVRHNDADSVTIDVSVEEGPTEIVVKIADNGPGIPDEDKVRVFEPSTKRGNSPGDGVGLSLVKRLVDSYGGRVWFEDGDEGGAVACVALQRA